MDNINLEAQVYFRELTSSAYFAAKHSLFLVAVAGLASANTLVLGIGCVALAAGFRAIEYKQSIRDPAFYILLTGGLLLCALNLIAATQTQLPVQHLAASTIAGLMLFYLVFSLMHEPFTHLYGKVTGIPLLRRQHCCLWLSVYAVAALFVGFLPWAIGAVLTTVLVILACLVHTYLQLVGVGKVWHLPHSRSLGEFDFRRLNNTTDELKPLYELYVTELMPSLSEGPKFKPTPIAQLVSEKMAAEQDSWDSRVFFAAFHNQQMVGTMACQFDKPTQTLPFESGHSQPLSLNKLREIGKIVELGKFCVLEQYRMSPEVFGGLLICAIEMALERDASFLVVQSVMRSSRIYSKMGFCALTKEPVLNSEYGVQVQLLAKNISNKSDAKNRMLDNVEKDFSPYILSRFIWRQIVQAFYRKVTNRQVPASIPTGDLANLAIFS